MKYILTRSKYVLSARALRDYLNDITIERFKVIKIDRIDNPPIADIEWGIYKALGRVSIGDRLKNNNINSITYNINNPENSFPIFVRKVLDGNQGRGIVIVKNKDEYVGLEQYYWSKFIPFEFELGVHVINGKIEKLFKKICMDEEKEFPIRNIKNNYKFSLRDVNKYKTLPEFISKAHEILKFEFCRYDIGWNRENGYYCIETNTAPSLANNFDTLSLYGDYFINKLNLQRR